MLSCYHVAKKAALEEPKDFPQEMPASISGFGARGFFEDSLTVGNSTPAEHSRVADTPAEDNRQTETPAKTRRGFGTAYCSTLVKGSRGPETVHCLTSAEYSIGKGLRLNETGELTWTFPLRMAGLD